MKDVDLWDFGIVRPRAGASAGASEGLFVPSQRYREQPTTHLLILEQGRNPTTDYYLRPRFPAPDRLPTTVADLAAEPESVPIPAGTFVVIVRYLNRAWARHLLNRRERLSGVAYLMDDDLPASLRARELPLRYRWKILRLFAAQRHALARLCDRIWVSNAYLAEKYAGSGATVLSALPLTDGWGQATPVTYFYYGTASHRREQAWLVEVVRSVQAQTRDLTFVTIGDASVRRLYAGIPRVLVLHPMPWPSFVEALPALRHDIGLAPLLDGAFNRSRSPTKFFDFTRLGAVGIYSAESPYARFVVHGVNGVVVPNSPDTWCRAILDLSASAASRAKMLERAREAVDRMSMWGHSLALGDQDSSTADDVSGPTEGS